MRKTALLAVVCTFGFCLHASATSILPEASAFGKLDQDIAKLKTATDLTPQQCYNQGYTLDGHGGCKIPPSHDQPIVSKDVNVTKRGVSPQNRLPAPSAELTSDAVACNDHRPQLLSELHDAQRHLIAVENWTMPPPYYGGPAFVHRLLAFNQRKQNLESHIRVQIATINTEGQREADCIVAREREREREKLTNFQSIIWEHIASRDIAYFKGGIVELIGEYFDGGEDVGHDPNRGVGRVMSRIAHYQGRTFNDTDPSVLAAETAFNDVLSGSMLMRMKHHIDPKSAVKVVAVGDQAKRMEAACLPPNRASLSPCYGAEITGKIRNCVAPQNFPGRAQEIADREWGRWLCLYATSIKPFDRNFNPVFTR